MRSISLTLVALAFLGAGGATADYMIFGSDDYEQEYVTLPFCAG